MLRCTFGLCAVSNILKMSIKAKPTVPVLDHNVPLRHFSTLRQSYRNTNGLLPLASAFLGTSQNQYHKSAPNHGLQKKKLSDDSRKRSLRLMDFPEVVRPTLMTRIKNKFFSVLIMGYFDKEFTTTSFLEGAQQVCGKCRIPYLSSLYVARCKTIELSFYVIFFLQHPLLPVSREQIYLFLLLLLKVTM